jgi:FtsH-binding integral membrane protein
VQANPAILIVSIVLTFVFLFALSCFPTVARTYPTNFLCLAGFTLCQSLLVGTIASTYSPDTVVKAVVATGAITLGLTLFAFQTRIECVRRAGGGGGEFPAGLPCPGTPPHARTPHNPWLTPHCHPPPPQPPSLRGSFTTMSSAMFCLLIVLLLFGVWTSIFPSQVANTAYAALGAFVFSLFSA